MDMGMENLKVSCVDPRYVSQEDSQPAYRMDFWDENRASYENRIENADSVDDVRARAEADRRGRYVVIRVEYSYEGGTGMCRLHGWDPLETNSPSAKDPYFRR